MQLLVDCLLSFAPFALYPKLGVLTALLCPVLAIFYPNPTPTPNPNPNPKPNPNPNPNQVLVIFYRGFLQLSKSLLDPFGTALC